jgi:threonine dehydratase
MTSSNASPPTIDDIRDAAIRLRGKAYRTPLLESPQLNAILGGRLLVKAECLQRTGSFKFRGAYNAISRLDASARRAGVVAFSSGNHAQGVAAAAQILGVPATIVMPSDAPAIKVANTRGYGAEVVLYDRYKEDREAIAARLAAERGLATIRPFDDAHVMAGQGTTGLEIVEQAAEAETKLDAVLAASSGGGLIAGIGIAVKDASPATEIYCVEPEGYDDHARSLAAGERTRIQPERPSIADALLAEQPGALTFSVNKRQLSGALVVGDDEMRAAMAAAFTFLKIVVEPGGSAPLAAIITGKLPIRGRAVVAVASGGNVDPETFAAAIRAGWSPAPTA